MRGTISIVDEVVKTYSLPIEKDDNGHYDFSGLYLAHSNISGKDPNKDADKDFGIDMGNVQMLILTIVDLRNAT